MKHIHGHEVIAFIKNANPPLKKTALLTTLKKEFGDAHFYTCSQSDLTLDALLIFLETAGKLYFDTHGLASINTANVCKDDGD